MTDIYVRSSDGNDADNGSTWALAKAKATGATAIEAAGDTINFSSAHSETTGANISLTLAGTATNPCRLLSVNDSAEPPTTIAGGATVATSGGNYSISFSGSFTAEGMNFTSGSGGTTGGFTIGGIGAFQNFISGHFQIQASTSSAAFLIGSGNVSSAMSRVYFQDVSFTTAHVAHSFNIINGKLIIKGGTFNTAWTTFCTASGVAGRPAELLVEAVDLSALDTAVNLVVMTGAARCIFRGVKLPASWSGLLVSGTVPIGARAEMYDSLISGGAEIKLRVADSAGTIRDETTIVRTGGSAESWRMVSNSTANRVSGGLDSPEIYLPQLTTGSPVTAKVHVVTDGVTLTDADMSISVLYRGTSGSPVYSGINDAPATSLTTPANQASSSETWTTTGLSSPVKQELSVTFTPQEAGYAVIVVTLKKASTTVYVCPQAE